MQELPFDFDLETRTVLKSLPQAHAALAELKGVVATIPNQNILLNTLSLREAQQSSAIENIITTADDLYKQELNISTLNSQNAKEVQNYVAALKLGHSRILQKKLFTNAIILEIQEALEKNNAGFRKLPGTSLKNANTGEIVYMPPQDPEEIRRLMDNLERFINDTTISNWDPLVKMAVIHFQFESIHPFYDGNGRTGRIVNILYLVIQGLQDLPILYLSRYIIQNKDKYYRLLQSVRETNQWEEWLLFLIKGAEETARETIVLINQMKNLMQEYKTRIRDHYKFYSQDLLNNLFRHPYTKIEFIVKDLGVSRITAAHYLNTLAKDGLLKKEKLGVGNYYINIPLFQLLGA
jgi:Fic family protein